jgi:hypothetical protein
MEEAGVARIKSASTWQDGEGKKIRTQVWVEPALITILSGTRGALTLVSSFRHGNRAF